MDWHFRVNRRITEYEKKGQHRSWLVDKMVCLINLMCEVVSISRNLLTRSVGLDQHQGNH